MRLLLLAALAGALALPLPLPLPLLPILSWPAYSDWLNVKTCGATGDGITDDTRAVQKCMDSYHIGNNFTVFFPAGTYLIKDTIVINRTLGAALMGMGRTTVLKWGGGPAPTNANNNVSVMVWSLGNTRFYTEGFSFDAGNGCAVGLDHANRPGSQYESFNTHRNMRFSGFSVAGIRFGHAMPPHGQDIASAEQQFTNVIFDKNFAGVSFLAWNSYDNYFSGAVFADNAFGIQCIACNYYVQKCGAARLCAHSLHARALGGPRRPPPPPPPPHTPARASRTPQSLTCCCPRTPPPCAALSPWALPPLSGKRTITCSPRC